LRFSARFCCQKAELTEKAAEQDPQQRDGQSFCRATFCVEGCRFLQEDEPHVWGDKKGKKRNETKKEQEAKKIQ